MNIRKATVNDAESIRKLLEQLDYPTDNGFIENKLPLMIAHPDEELMVFEMDNAVLGFISIHFVPQIALDGDFAVISYFAVDEAARSKGVGKALEAYCHKLAVERNCDRIQVHCHSRRTDAHRFYEREGYQESPKYFIKKLR